jgi:hypothetical protein
MPARTRARRYPIHRTNQALRPDTCAGPAVSVRHLASVPATAPNWAGAAGLINASVLLAGLGIAGFARRDLSG